MKSKLFLSLILAIAALGLDGAPSKNIATEKQASKQKLYTFKKRNRSKNLAAKKTVEDTRYAREITADLQMPTPELREPFNREDVTPRPKQTTQMQEYFDNH